MFGQNHILNENFYNKKLTYENVSSETLFNIYKNSNFLNTSSVFVKIDIEGSEYHLFNCLKKTGVGVIVISHRMDDIFAVSDRVMALFQGTNFAEAELSKTSRDEVIGWIMGKK